MCRRSSVVLEHWKSHVGHFMAGEDVVSPDGSGLDAAGTWPLDLGLVVENDSSVPWLRERSFSEDSGPLIPLPLPMPLVSLLSPDGVDGLLPAVFVGLGDDERDLLGFGLSLPAN